MPVVRSFRWGAVRPHVLHHALEGEITGAWMAAQLARNGYRISLGTLYPALHQLKAQSLSSGETVADGRVGRGSRMTGRALGHLRDALRELAREVLE